MHNAVTKILITIVMWFFIYNNTAYAQEPGGGIGGNYICNNGCNPSNPLDGLTVIFIRTVVNQDVDIWRIGDTVNIYNTNGDGGEWGRLDAGSTFRMKRELYDGNPQAGNGSSGNDSGSGSSGGSNGGGIVIIGGGSSGDPCPGGVTIENDVITCHQS